MARLVVKFGGTSMAGVDRIKAAAHKVAQERALGHDVVVVVSAMSGVTNELVGFCDALVPEGALMADAARDAVLSSGEQVTAGLMSLALQALNIPSRAYSGWQVPLTTDATHTKARILEISPDRLTEDLAAGLVPVVAGFQGVTETGWVTTLGRGGSDTSAVALAAVLKADRCDIYTDVDGVYTTDPRVEAKARKLCTVTAEEMLEMAAQGAKVLQTRSVEMAMRHGVVVQVLSSFESEIGSTLPGTLITLSEGGKTMESRIVTGIAFSRDEAQVTLRAVPDRPGIAAAIFSPLAEAAINIDMIVQDMTTDGKATDLTFTLPRRDLAKAVAVLSPLQASLGFSALETDNTVAKISLVGVGMRSNPGVAALMFKTFSDKNINIRVIATSEIKISVLIDEDATELAVRALHGAYHLDTASA